MLLAHHEAAKALAREHPLLADAEIADISRATPGDTLVKSNYLVLSTRLPGYAGGRLAAPEDVDGDYMLELWWRVVAVDLEGLCELVDAIREQFVGQLLAVTGRSLTRFTSELEEIQHDPRVDVLFQDLYLDATTSRAT